jgi:hypothetical protein
MTKVELEPARDENSYRAYPRGWAGKQAQLLREKCFDERDVPNRINEVPALDAVPRELSSLAR